MKRTEPTRTCTTHILANVNIFNNKLVTPATPSLLTKSAVFIKKDYPNPVTADYSVVMPSTYDITTAPPATETPVTDSIGDVLPTDGTLSPPIVNNSAEPNINANDRNNTH